MTVGPRFTLREVQPGDARALAAAEAVCFEDPWPEPYFVTELFAPGRFHRVMVDVNGSLAAYLFTAWQYLDLHILKVATLPAYRRRGLGRRLMLVAGLMAEMAAALVRPLFHWNPKVSRFAVNYTCNDFTFSSAAAEQDFEFRPVHDHLEALAAPLQVRVVVVELATDQSPSFIGGIGGDDELEQAVLRDLHATQELDVRAQVHA